MKIYVEDDKGAVIFATMVGVNENIEEEPVSTGVATLLLIKRGLVAAAGVQLGADWWKDD